MAGARRSQTDIAIVTNKLVRGRRGEGADAGGTAFGASMGVGCCGRGGRQGNAKCKAAERGKGAYGLREEGGAELTVTAAR